MTGQIIVLGATGYTGGLVVQSLLRRGERPVLAGRSAERLRSVASAHGGLDTRTVDAQDAAAVRDLLAPGDVLVSTVGPFATRGSAPARAAAEVGAHYLDSTGEVDFVEAVTAELGAEAERSGATLVPAFGFDYVPGMLAGHLAAEDAGPAVRSLHIGYFMSGSMRGGISAGTQATMGGSLLGTNPVLRDGRLAREPIAAWTRAFTVLGSRRRAVLGPGTEVLHLPPLHPAIRDLEVYNGWTPSLSRAISGASRLTHGLARNDALRARLEAGLARLTSGGSGGPDAEARAAVSGIAVAVARDRSQAALSQVTVRGPNTYTVTGELLAEGAIAVRDGAGQAPGVLGPIQAFGDAGFRRICAQAGLHAAFA